MHIEFLSKFNKDLNSLKSNPTKSKLLNIINQVKAANNISDIQNLKKLKGHKEAYRIRIGDYRLGIFIEGDLVQFARFVHRKDIYCLFP
jgi:mRNA interferase RelE/StbE